jgi:hypothetical protein
MLTFKQGVAALALGAVMVPATACASSAGATSAATTEIQAPAPISKADVLAAQKLWSDGIVTIGAAFKAGGDYREAAEDHIATLYAYDQGGVLFKPTLAAQDQFRETKDEALSYFVGGSISEDKGFAIRPWTNVRWGEQEILTQGDTAYAMGNYYFTPDGSTDETKVEFTFVYIRDPEGQLRISVHHSSVPYTP